MGFLLRLRVRSVRSLATVYIPAGTLLQDLSMMSYEREPQVFRRRRCGSWPVGRRCDLPLLAASPACAEACRGRAAKPAAPEEPAIKHPLPELRDAGGTAVTQ